MDHENTTCYLFLDSACSWAEDPVSCHGHAGELAVLLAGPAALVAQKTSLMRGLFSVPCPRSTARVLAETHLLCLWTADRILDVAWSFLLDGVGSGSFTLSSWTVSWSLVTLSCVPPITDLAALAPLLTCEIVPISSACYHKVSVSQHTWQDWIRSPKKLRTVCK